MLAHKLPYAITDAARKIGTTARDQSRWLVAARHPTDMPRKVASSTMFVKNVRNTTVLPNQRMQASSKNNMRKLTRNKSAYARDGRERRLIRNTRGDCRSRERVANNTTQHNTVNNRVLQVVRHRHFNRSIEGDVRA